LYPLFPMKEIHIKFARKAPPPSFQLRMFCLLIT